MVKFVFKIHSMKKILYVFFVFLASFQTIGFAQPGPLIAESHNTSQTFLPYIYDSTFYVNDIQHDTVLEKTLYVRRNTFSKVVPYQKTVYGAFYTSLYEWDTIKNAFINLSRTYTITDNAQKKKSDFTETWDSTQ